MPELQFAIGSVDAALDTLATEVGIDESTAASHTVLRITGLESAAATGALGRYLTATIAGAVNTDASLASEFLHFTADPLAELQVRVTRAVGTDNAYTSEAQRDFVDRSRNPWIAEGIGHLLLMLRSRVETACLSGPVAALSIPHSNVKQAGIDLFAIYVQGEVPALAIGEGKATENNPSGELTNAIGFFRKVDQGKRDEHIVDAVVVLKGSLDPEIRAQLGEAIWRDRCAYLPLVVFGAVDFAPGNTRPALRALAPPVERKRLLVVELSEFRSFFNDVADAMRSAPAELLA